MGRSRNQEGGVVRTLLTLFVVVGVLGVLAAGAVFWEVNRRMEAPGPLASPDLVWIERGDGIATVGAKLEEMGALEDPRLFAVAARLQQLAPDLRAGEFEVPAGASIEAIITLLKEGKPVLRFVTIPEGLTVAQIAQRLNEAPVLTGELEELPPEGALLPETYSYQRNDSRASVIERMKTAHDEVLAALWETRAPDLPIDTPEEAVILASIVEKETGVAAERPRVAAVFINRLRRGMRLQSDPTVIYGITKGEPLGRGLRVSELRGETPYNTYVIRGLPPTPIANPGRDALAAVLNPAETDEYYFVADGTGGHVFSKTLAEHNRNVARWRQIERDRRAAAN